MIFDLFFLLAAGMGKEMHTCISMQTILMNCHFLLHIDSAYMILTGILGCFMLRFCLNLPFTVLDAVFLVGCSLCSLAFLLVAQFWCVFNMQQN